MWCMGAFQAANSRSHAEQPILIRRRDASSSLVGFYGGIRTCTSSHSSSGSVPTRRMCTCWFGSKIGISETSHAPGSADHFEHPCVRRYDLRQRAAGTGAVELNCLVQLEMASSVGWYSGLSLKGQHDAFAADYALQSHDCV